VSSIKNGKLFVLEGPKAGQEFELSQPNTSLGRESGVDIVLTTTAVSRRHAQVTQENSQYYIEDLGSSNGTYLNGQRISGRQMLRDGDQVGLGQSVIMRFDAPAKDDATAIYDPSMDAGTAAFDNPATTIEPPIAAAAAPPPPPQLAPEPQPQLIITIGSGVPQTYDLAKATLKIGRSPESDIVLDSKIVSRLHLTLKKIPSGYRVEVNPQAGNPVILHGRPIAPSHNLNDGDELTIGQADPTSQVKISYRGLPAEDFATQLGSPAQDDSRTQIAAPVAPVAAPPQAHRPPPARPVADDLAGVGTQIMSPGAYQMGASAAAGPSTFTIAIAGKASQTYNLTKERYTIGRSPENDIVIDSSIVSRNHARLDRLSDGTYQIGPSPDAGNPIH
jgi:pSer/pThr/pTyr-binding forkhead associated (FHA) protein